MVKKIYTVFIKKKKKTEGKMAYTLCFLTFLEGPKCLRVTVPFIVFGSRTAKHWRQPMTSGAMWGSVSCTLTHGLAERSTKQRSTALPLYPAALYDGMRHIQPIPKLFFEILTNHNFCTNLTKNCLLINEKLCTKIIIDLHDRKVR